jgi:hypothetical protein
MKQQQQQQNLKGQNKNVPQTDGGLGGSDA